MAEERERAPLGREGTVVSRVLEVLALLFAAGMALLVVCQNLGLTAERVRAGRYSWRWVLLAAAGMAVLVLGLWALGRVRAKDRTLLLVTLAVCAGLRLGYMLAVRTPIQSDFALLYDAARGMAAGDMGWAESGYFRWWGYQIPFVAYQALVLKLFPSVWALKVLNLAFMVGVDCLICRIAGTFVSERAAVGAAALYAVYPAAIHMAAVLTNQHISTFFLLLGVWLLLSGRSWKRLPAAGAALAVGNLMRPEGVVFLAALVCWCGWFFLQKPSKKRAGGALGGAAVVLAAFWLVQTLAGTGLAAAGLAPHGIGNTRPEWKFAVGLDALNTGGGYSERNAFILDIADDAQRKAETRRVVEESFAACEDVPGFFLSKTELMWAEEESFFWSTGHLNGAAELLPGVTVDRCLSAAKAAEKAVYLLVWLSVPGAAWLLWRERGRRRAGGLFCLVSLCGFFCVFLLIEVQARYRYVVMPLLFLLLGVTLDWVYRRWGRRD